LNIPRAAAANTLVQRNQSDYPQQERKIGKRVIDLHALTSKITSPRLAPVWKSLHILSFRADE
jgi:hypothetical protein